MEAVYTEKNMCSGCGACKDICPFGAIEMELDKEGFYYPRINQYKCINCGLCTRRCPFNRKYSRFQN